jgi:hypothetical protein
MKIRWIAACREVIETEVEGTDVKGIGVDTTFAPGEPPWGLPIVVAVCLEGDAREIGSAEVHGLTWQLSGPDFSVVAEGQETLLLESESTQYEAWATSRVIGVSIYAEVQELGDYSVAVRLDDGLTQVFAYRVLAEER